MTPSLDDYRDTPLETYLSGSPILDLSKLLPAPDGPLGKGSYAAVFAPYQLQDIGDYRSALQSWFAEIRTGGYLVIVVPHAFLHDRLQTLPSPFFPRKRRLYTPRLLLGEIEEALTPNTYRIRWLADDDAEYDYRLGLEDTVVGHCDIIAVVEKIASPDWVLGPVHAPPGEEEPDFAFEPTRTRIEHLRTEKSNKVLILKLDHLGDFIMSIPALERVRQAFPEAEITLVVGSWNRDMAAGLGLADHVLQFDAFPRNSSEERVDVPGKTALFDALVTGVYDIAIDLRVDHDTRILLRNVNAAVKAGIGTKSQFEFLDIFLPIDFSRNDFEAAWQKTIPVRDFAAQDYCIHNRFMISCRRENVRRERNHIIYGPYWSLHPSRYIFETVIEFDPETPGMLSYDIVFDQRNQILEGYLSQTEELNLHFHNEKERGVFEFRLRAVEGEPIPNFHFYGGRLIKQSASSVLHQSEYMRLLIELVAMRVRQYGLLREYPVKL
jgi:hypothetical protein